MRILGIETSCDETGAAVVEAKPGKPQVKLLSNVVASSLALHAKTGGIIPEVAAREQVWCIIPVIKEALIKGYGWGVGSGSRSGDGSWGEKCPLSPLKLISRPTAHISPPPIDAIAVTIGPGLIGSLLVGVETAKTLAYVWQKPIVPVNHLIGHIYANWVLTTNKQQLTTNPSTSLRASKLEVSSQKLAVEFPALALLVSGGHTDLVLMKNHGKFNWLGGTRDDAAGECFDKCARVLGLGYPGGPAIAAKAAELKIKNYELRIKLPRPMIEEDDFDFSFSGLKTAVLREVNKLKTMKQWGNETIVSLSAEVQQAIVDVLVAKTIRAAQKYKIKSILLAGGVAANDLLREMLEVGCRKLGVKFFVPAKNLCTDNAAMIASAAFFNFRPIPWQKIKVDPDLYFC